MDLPLQPGRLKKNVRLPIAPDPTEDHPESVDADSQHDSQDNSPKETTEQHRSYTFRRAFPPVYPQENNQ